MARYGATANLATGDQILNRRSDGWLGQGLYNGDGLYTGDGKYNAGRNFRHWASGAVKNVGKGVGAALNASLLGGISQANSYAGQGLYSSNNLVGGGRPSVQFDSSNDETQSLVITHKEYIGDVYAPATSGFVNGTYQLQPGLSTVFPFLAQFAQNFDEYEMHQMVWEFHSTVDANASTNSNGNTGTIIMATNYKADALPFSNKDEMIQYHGGVSGRLTEPLVHGVECDPDKVAGSQQKFVRTRPVGNSDIKSYDIGTLNLAFQNTPIDFLNKQVGELWVYYKVKLAKPKLFASLGNGITQARFLVTDESSLLFANPASTLKAQNNSLQVLIGPSIYTPGVGPYQSVTPTKELANQQSTSSGFEVTFPASLSGVYEITFRGEFAGGASFGNDSAYVLFATNSNIKPWFDMFCSTVDGLGGGVGYYLPDAAAAVNDQPWFYHVNISVAQTQTITCRIKLEGVSNGVDNKLAIFPFGTNGSLHSAIVADPTASPPVVGVPAASWTSHSVDIIEIGSPFARSGTVQAPVWLNAVTNEQQNPSST